MMRAPYPSSPTFRVDGIASEPPQDGAEGRTNESPLDHALTLLLAGEVDAAMRWAAAVLERSPSPASLLVTCRLLDQMGRTRAAIDGLKLAVQLSVDRGDLPLAMAGIDDLRSLGVDGTEEIDLVATAFCKGSPRLERAKPLPLLPALPGYDFVQPLSPFLSGPSLASKATQAVQDARHRYQEGVAGELPGIRPLALFSALPKNALVALLSQFHAVTVPAGHTLVAEGDAGSEAYVVVRGEVEISRRAAHGDTNFTLALSRLRGGAFFGEMALLSNMPSPASARATRPTILLSASRDDLIEVSSNLSEIATQLAIHCRRNSLATLGWTSPVVAAVPPGERAALVERLEMRIFEKGDLLVRSGEEVPGLNLIVSGEVAIVAKEWGERVLLATLGAGDTVGEMELVLCRRPFADAVATRPTAALFLSRSEYASLIQDHPAILHGLYAVAVQRQADTNFVLDSAAAVVSDDWLLDASSLNAPIDSPLPPPLEKPVAATLHGLGALRAEVIEASRPNGQSAAAAPAPAPVPVSAPTAVPVTVPAKPVVEVAARRTLPPPPPPLPTAPLPRTPTLAPTSVSPSTSSVRPASVTSPPQRTPWMGVAAVTGATAVAASVITVLALRSATPAVAASQPRPAPVDVLPAAAAPPPPAAAPAAPVAPPSAPVAALSAQPVPSASAAASAQAGSSEHRVAPVVTATTPAATPVKTMPVATVARAPQRVAVQASPAAAPTPAAPAAVSAADDEFGGRN